MKCPHCKTNVTKIPVSWKCPHCGETLPEPGYWFRFFEGFSDYLIEKGNIFWSIIFMIFLITLGSFEFVFGYGFLVKYIAGNFLLALVMIFFGGMLIDMYMKVVLPLHLPFGGGDFIIKERAVIRNIRKGSHIAGGAGILVSLFWLGPRTFVAYFPSYLIVIGIFLALAWAISGLFLDMRMVDDVRFRFYMDRLGITSLKYLRKICTIVIGGLFVAILTFYMLNLIPGLWHEVSEWGIVAGILFFVKNYLGWLF